VDRSGIRAIFCTSGGKGLYLSATPQPGIFELSYTDLTGQVRVLWQLKGDFGRGLSPSPDGRYLAMVGIMTTSDAWLLENF